MIEIRKAIAAHGLWKVKLKEVVSSGNPGGLQPVAVGRHDGCEFGRWLLGIPPQVRASPHFAEVQRVHADFHRAAAEVLVLTVSRKPEEALRAMDTGQFATCSARLILLLTEWERELESLGQAA